MKKVAWQTLADIDGIITHLEYISREFEDFARIEEKPAVRRRISRYTPRIETAIRTLRKMQEYYGSLA